VSEPTPETDAFCSRMANTTKWPEKMRDLERQRDEAREKLEFLKSKGLTVGLAISSDCPQGQLVYVIKPESELCDLKHIHATIDADVKCNQARDPARELRDALGYLRDATSCTTKQYELIEEALIKANQILK